MASKRKLSLVQKLKADILALKSTHAEQVKMLRSNLEEQVSIANQRGTVLQTLCSFFKGERLPYRIDFDVIKYDALPKVVLELILFRERHEGATSAQGNELKRQFEMIRWFVNPDTASTSGELERLKKHLEQRGIYMDPKNNE